MIRIQQLKLPIRHTEADLKARILKKLGIREDAMISYEIRKQSIDARKKPELFYVYTADVNVRKEAALKKKKKQSDILFLEKEKPYRITTQNDRRPDERPVIIGMGPAGLFCGLELARLGFRPLILERGAAVEERMKDVEKFWETGILNPDSNVQFGEGGAGTFSDGKLNTMVHDNAGRGRYVLEQFVKYGAPEEILWQNKPHIGTDILVDVVRNMRRQIQEYGGEIRFHSQVTDVLPDEQCLIVNGEEKIHSWAAVLAIGHSARDTFRMLLDRGTHMEAKSFAVGVRVEHPQRLIDQNMYGREERGELPAASYKLTAKLENGRGVYTFCMCPGGYVVNASSEPGQVAVNGMSYHGRAGENANSAVIVTVTPDDYGADHPLSGVEFQRKLERRAWEEGDGQVPTQRFEDFCENRKSSSYGTVKPNIKGQHRFGNVRRIFPEELASSLEQGIKAMDRKIRGFAEKDTLLSGVESRTSSPVRICRDQEFRSSIPWIFPCGEGAGYAGGITSAAMDGLKVAEALVQAFDGETR